MKRPEMPLRRTIRDALHLGQLRIIAYLNHLLAEADRLSIEVDVEKMTVKELEKKIKLGNVRWGE